MGNNGHTCFHVKSQPTKFDEIMSIDGKRYRGTVVQVTIAAAAAGARRAITA